MPAWTNALKGDYNNYCGNIEYELVGGNKAWIEFNPATRVILVKPTLNSHATSPSGINYTIKGKLTKFPTRLLTKVFRVIIRICPTSWNIATSISSTKLYRIGIDNVVNYPFSITFAPV
jgi:hypothetical protein